ncbi:cytochrome P450 2A13-like [Pelobates fuscus]|uniref:cytochrome P450 2A13-like n=1 Tax=Pelobates fuscus TaxID=191477 RepID=UPI002FE4EBBA
MDITFLGSLLLTLLVSCLLIYSTWNKLYRKRNLPPGPTPLPLLGNILQIKRGELVKSLLEFGKKYGPVYTLYFGPRRVVVLCGYQAVKEALIDQADEFSNRGKQSNTDSFVQGFGVVFSNGERWKQLRRFSLTTLRNFGMGKRSIEERIQEEAQCLMAEVRSYKGKSFDPTSILVQCVSNVISSVVFGSRFEYNNKNLQTLLSLFAATFTDMSSPWGQLHEMLPMVMKYIPGPHHRINKHLNKLLEFVSKRVKNNEETLDPDSPRDYIDCFLIKMQQEKQNPMSNFHMKNLLMTVLNLFFAGTETVSTTLRHGFLILLKYPEIEAKLHEEIDHVIGQNRSPTIEDRSQMPYTDAVIHEIQRFSDVIPMNVPHSVTKDTKFRGYDIPKGTDVYPLLCAVLRDPKQFTTPNKFNPNHFLDERGHFKKNEAFMPFSTGKRICLGEGLARMELFLFLTTILQNFKLSSKTQFTESDITPKMNGFANYPIPYQLSFIPYGSLHSKTLTNVKELGCLNENEKNPETPFDTVNLVATVFDMFLGGAETTALSINFGFLILIKFPEIQECLHEEIDQVIGRARDPVVEDKNNTPYLNAFLHEALRFSDVLPMGVARRATKDVNFRGFLIPKGMDILPMLTTVLHDPSHFETPSVFNVKHFLDENGKFKKNNAFLAFDAGKRNCIGESLVRLEIYIFFAIILQKFTLKATVDPKDLDINPVECGFESLPPVHEIMFIPRE